MARYVQAEGQSSRVNLEFVSSYHAENHTYDYQGKEQTSYQIVFTEGVNDIRWRFATEEERNEVMTSIDATANMTDKDLYTLDEVLQAVNVYSNKEVTETEIYHLLNP